LNSPVAQALVLVVMAAIMNGAYVLPMKLNKKWQWEHSWFAFSILGVALVPTLIALATVPQLWSTYSAVSFKVLFLMAVFGAGWGVALVFTGLSLKRLGLAITFAVSLGTSAAVGALTPLATQHSDRLMTGQGGLILLGVLIILVGVGFCGLAGYRRERETQSDSLPPRKGYQQGLILAFLSGILGSMLNLGLAFGGSIQRAAQQHGASVAMMSNAVWLPCLYAGSIPGAIYCYYLMKQKKTLSALTLAGTWYYWPVSASMGLLWFGSIILYSISTVKLGALGPVIGWPLFLGAIVISSTVLGAATGEWSNTGKTPIKIMILGVGCLVLAIAILSYAGNIDVTKSQSTHRLASPGVQSELADNRLLKGALNDEY
jgi:L-rhamnose-H+ transport protein